MVIWISLVHLHGPFFVFCKEHHHHSSSAEYRIQKSRGKEEIRNNKRMKNPKKDGKGKKPKNHPKDRGDDDDNVMVLGYDDDHPKDQDDDDDFETVQ
jgi:hypothetical protein